MIINQITLKNFKSYADETTLVLKPQDNKNIILIGGENGAGKSTLFEAIKLCIYGPMVYGYIGHNYHYINYIKSIINDNAFTKNNIEAYVSLDISFNNRIDENSYILTRSWAYSDQKVNESFIVEYRDKVLENEELDLFEQYLKSALPPFLFEYFFFDGENLSNFFGSSSTNTDLYDALIQLLNFDSFDILKKQLNTFNITQSRNKFELENAQKRYKDTLDCYTSTKNEIEDLLNRKEKLEIELIDLSIEKEQLYKNFKKSGGLLADERNEMLSQISYSENKRTDINMSIRNFCNDQLPFIMMSNLLVKLSNQLKKEKLLASYNIISEKLSPAIIMEALSDTLSMNDLSIDDASNVSKRILSLIYNENIINNTTEILGLSKEQNSFVLNTCSSIITNKDELSSNLIKQYEELDNISENLKVLRAKINSSSSEEHLNEYINSLNAINEKYSNSSAMLQATENILANLENELFSRQAELTKAKNANISLLQSSNISNITTVMQDFIDELLKNLTKDKINLIQFEFIDIFHKIIRKENFIDTIFIDDSFRTTLYIKKSYSRDELINIINNIGYQNITNTYGEMFIEDLKNYIKFESAETMWFGLISSSEIDEFVLLTKVNLNSLSNGEKQIYVLCLIWAILKVSNVEIPFIIDTPYSRIDTTHRNGLTNHYLPKISRQVIVLSTNEEIDIELYKTIKPYTAREYLLVYDTENRKTTIKNNYFEV